MCHLLHCCPGLCSASLALLRSGGSSRPYGGAQASSIQSTYRISTIEVVRRIIVGPGVDAAKRVRILVCGIPSACIRIIPSRPITSIIHRSPGISQIRYQVAIDRHAPFRAAAPIPQIALSALSRRWNLITKAAQPHPAVITAHIWCIAYALCIAALCQCKYR